MMSDTSSKESVYSNGNGNILHINGHNKHSSSDGNISNLTSNNRRKVPSWYLFRFSKCLDVLCMLLGFVAATIAGSSLPLMFLILGFAVSEFTGYTIVTSVTDSNTYYNNSLKNYFCNTTNQYSDYFTSTDPGLLLKDNVSVLSYYLIGIATALFVSSLVSNILWTFTSLRQTKRMRLAFLESVLKQDIGYYDVNSPTELPTRLADDIQKIEEGIGYNFANFIQECIGLLVGLVIAISLNWKLALVTSTLLPLLLIVMLIVGKVSASVTFKEQSILAQAGSVAEEVLSAIKTVVAFGGERREIERYTNLLKKAKAESYRKQFTVSLIYGFYTLVFFAFYALGIWYGGNLIIECGTDPGIVLTVVVEIASISFNLGNALPLFLSIIDAIGAAAGVYPIIDQVPTINTNDNNAIEIRGLQGDIEFSNVVFSYPSRPDVPILRGMGLHIKAGQTVALVGPSGSGKSTILQLIQHLYTHNEGTIKIDGIDIRNLNVTQLRNQIGIVSQEPDLFNVSISENISYGKESATGADIARAAKASNAYNFIMMLPNKFETVIGEGGDQLSGGQKQCIAIARALIRDPKILLLDEATSALDTGSEKLVQEALDKAREGRTTIIIAHRLSTVKSADVIMTVDNGRIVEVGTHSELMASEGVYFELIQNQIISDGDNNKSTSNSNKKIAVTRDFANAYRQSIKHRQSVTRRVSSSTGGTLRQVHPSVTQATSITGNTLRKSRRPSARQLVREGSAIGSLGRRVIDGLSPLSDFSVPPTPRTPKFSPHNIFELDDVFELPEGTGGSSIHLEGNQPPASWKTMLMLNRKDWWLLLIGISGFVFVGILLSTVYILFSKVVEAYSETDKDTLLQKVMEYSVVYLAIGAVGFLVHFIATFSLSIAADRLTTRMKQKSFEDMMSQDMSFFDKPQNSVSILTARLAEDTSEVSKATGMSLGLTVRGICNIFAGYIIIFEASWVLGFLSLITLFVFVIEGFLQLRLTNLFLLKSFECQSDGLKTAIEAIDSVYTVVTLGIEKRLVNKYHDQLKKPFKYDIQGCIIQSLLYAIAQSSSVYILGCAINVGAYIYTADDNAPYYANFDEVFRAIGAMFYTGWLFKELFRSLPDTQSAQISASNLLGLFDEAPKINTLSSYGLDPKEEENVNTAKLKLSSVHFSYPSRPGISILPGLNLSVKHGRSLAIVGPSGCGKSTVLSLIERFYDPISGSLTFNGINTSIYNVTWLRRQMSLVSQEPVLFDMSIADNIRYGALYREVSDEEVVAAAKTANIHNFIMMLPQGYATKVGPKGDQLSGGQKQCVAIARALIRNPKILLLDEATSALDTENEKLVQEALDKARVGRTTIIIAHRLSTIHNADSIVVLHKGLAVEEGTHDELMEKRGTYYFMNSIGN